MIPKQNGFRTGSKPDWRKRLASITRYIDDLECCLSQANATIAVQANTIQELHQHIQYQNSLLGTNRGGPHECC